MTGRAPFTGPTAAAVLMVVARDPVEPPSRHRLGLPADLEQVILRCLAKSPADRFPDVEALDRALAACTSASEWDFPRAAEWWNSQARRSTASSDRSPTTDGRPDGSSRHPSGKETEETAFIA
jgi:serine/threonine-protein kinase